MTKKIPDYIELATRALEFAKSREHRIGVGGKQMPRWVVAGPTSMRFFRIETADRYSLFFSLRIFPDRTPGGDVWLRILLKDGEATPDDYERAVELFSFLKPACDFSVGSDKSCLLQAYLDPIDEKGMLFHKAFKKIWGATENTK